MRDSLIGPAAARLQAEFPHLSPASISAMVTSAASRYGDATVDAYLGNLVVREVRSMLRAHPPDAAVPNE